MKELGRGISKEFRVILLVVHPAGCDEREKEILDQLEDPFFDWDELFALLSRHRLWVRFHRKLAGLSIWGRISSARVGELKERSKLIQFHQLKLVGGLLRISETLRLEGIDYISLKGPALSQQLYGDPVSRQSGDLDLLVRRGDVLSAISVLESIGYRVRDRVWADMREKDSSAWDHLYHIHLYGFGIELELHWRLSRNDGLMPERLERLFERKQFVRINGTAVSALAGEDLYSYLAVHGGSHCWNRLGWLLDFVDFRVRQDVSWQKGGANRVIRVGESLCAILWPKSIACAEVGGWRVRFFISQILSEKEDPSGLGNLLRRSLILLSLYRGLAKVRYFWTLLVWPPVYEKVRLPRCASFLYPIIGSVCWGMKQLKRS